MKLSLIWTAPLLLALAPVAAQSADKADAPPKAKKVCRSVQVTGRRIGDTVCHTAEEWTEIDRANEESARKFMGRVGENATRSGGTLGGGPGPN